MLIHKCLSLMDQQACMKTLVVWQLTVVIHSVSRDVYELVDRGRTQVAITK